MEDNSFGLLICFLHNYVEEERKCIKTGLLEPLYVAVSLRRFYCVRNLLGESLF
jgi:hypothetical protein